MPEVPKIVRERLQVGSKPPSPHPDANVLAAFAEQVLSADENEGVLEHLALCGDCRELLTVSSPALVEPEAVAAEAILPAVETRTMRRKSSPGWSWLAWNRLGWAGLAAGIAVAIGVLFMQPGGQKKVNQVLQKPSSTAAPTVATAEKTAEKNVTSPAPASKPAAPIQRPPAPAAPVVRPNAFNRRANSLAPAKQHAEPLGEVADFATNAVALKGRASAGSAGQAASASEAVEVSGAPVMQAELAQTNDALVAKEAAPVVRAKAARALEEPVSAPKPAAAELKQENTATMGAAAPTVVVSNRSLLQRPGAPQNGIQTSQFPVQWAIRGDELQQSLDSGAHWKAVFQPHRPLLCFAARNTDVWVGGKEGDLFHSADWGVTWSLVHPSTPDQTLADDITHIEVGSPTQIFLTTGKNESWSTSDGGKTWQKK